MESIEQMIKRLCPKGVEYVKLGDCLKYEQPTKYQVSSKDYLDDGIPVLTAGQTFILGYTDEISGIYLASKDKPVIIFDDFTTSFHWVDFNFKVKSSAMKLLTPCSDCINFRYIYYAMKCIKYDTLEHSRQWISNYSQILIPLPPLEIQSRIVEVLDKMTTLTAELEARKQQYEYYRDKLLIFNEIGGGNRQVAWKKISEICVKVYSGRNKSKTEQGLYPVYGSTGIIGMCESPVYNKRQILVARVGANAGFVHLADGSYDVSDNTIIIDLSKEVNQKFVFYMLRNANLNKFAKGGGQPLLTATQIKDFVIPVPSMPEQQRIVSILDRFEALTIDLQSGLPAEIEARRQQYEYYRNKLLTFDAV